jgi:hypothetical protein
MLVQNEDYCVEAAVIQRLAGLCTDELFHQFIYDAVEILASNDVDISKLMTEADLAFDIEDVEDRIATLEQIVFRCEQALYREDYFVDWEDGYLIGRPI